MTSTTKWQLLTDSKAALQALTPIVAYSNHNLLARHICDVMATEIGKTERIKFQ